MRTNIEIDDTLMKAAMVASGAKTKRAAVEAGLKRLIDDQDRAETLRLFDSLKGIGWDGDLDEMRTSKYLDWDAR
ncbi:type II toxin-antitoxin system VapB family antitoxin [Sandaracinobacteroides saxicola]|uniref:Type II toxin-antitoxin system VapB family antitoxin n=1 Tax=Sandaracinobacteroides saxicola TaxID=2759707 RepID=A0A7G5IKX0_9SPHN|nr:type II toxin-antitoxin system VapB family antitoxin [Sandaracinobacteroides saxicola]QMW24012.1 type II toxin-antitoxin system VapB family antitoxin [Sandaracinobacteroides saxicola]